MNIPSSIWGAVPPDPLLYIFETPFQFSRSATVTHAPPPISTAQNGAACALANIQLISEQDDPTLQVSSRPTCPTFNQPQCGSPPPFHSSQQN